MKNVYKGFQVGKMAVPKIHAAKINSEFSSRHTLTAKRPFLKGSDKIAVAKTFKPIGKY